jgi:hypothetical protein
MVVTFGYLKPADTRPCKMSDLGGKNWKHPSMHYTARSRGLKRKSMCACARERGSEKGRENERERERERERWGGGREQYINASKLGLMPFSNCREHDSRSA